MDTKTTSYMWKECHFFLECAVEELLAMSFIKVGDNNVFWMHDQLRDLGREIVQEENNLLGERSRLWSSEDAMRVICNQQGTEKIEAINLDYGIHTRDYCLTREQFIKLSNLRFLKISKGNVTQDFHLLLPEIKWLQWHCCPVELMATSLSLENLVILDLSKSNITDKWSGWNSQIARGLKVLILEFCQNLTKTLDFSLFQSLERLSLGGCERLCHVDPSIGKLKENLVFLSLKDCFMLRILPQELSDLEALVELHIDGSSVQELPDLKGLKKLEILSAKRCKSLSEIPLSIGFLDSLLELLLDKSGVRTLPDSIKGLTSLEKLCLSETNLLTIPDSIRELTNLQVLLVRQTLIVNLPISPGMLENLITVDASYCRNLKGTIFLGIGSLCSLTTLRLCRTQIWSLPASISRFSSLETLDLTACDWLWALPKLPSSLRSLSVTCNFFPNLSNLVNLEELGLVRCYCPNYPNRIAHIGKLSKLKELRMIKTRISRLPQEIGTLSRLKKLVIENCNRLEHIPKLPTRLRELKVKGISIHTFPDLSNSTNLWKLEILLALNLKGFQAWAAYKS